MAEKKPLLSIGMIFKNEIRCLERCLQSLQPLREAVPCELVMADTGSDDGSREVAAKYADILFDFPWINDFAAARNAVMDKCSGKWYLTIDADEWLEDIEELVQFLLGSSRRRVVRSGRIGDIGLLIQRNYVSYSPALRDNYTDVYVPRMVSMATGLRYSGAIHEIWRADKNFQNVIFPQTVLHHDGYVGLNVNDEAGQAKMERNIALLREQLKEDPEDLRALSEYVDASRGDERKDYACRMMELVAQRKPGWQREGVHCFKAALDAAINLKMYDKMDEWIALAEEMFPHTFMVRLDMEGAAFQRSWEKKDYADCVRRGRRFLKAYEDYHAGRGDTNRYYAISMVAPRWKEHINIFLAYALFKEGEKEECLEILQKLDTSFVNDSETRFFTALLKDLQRATDYDVSTLLINFWQKINQPDFPRKEECQKGFAEEAACAFWPVNLDLEQQTEMARSAHTLFLSLGEQCDIGIAAMLMEAQNPAEMARLLGLVGDWETMPEVPVCRALLAGAKFPVEQMTLAEMDSLAGRFAVVSPHMLIKLAVKTAAGDFAANLPDLLWARGLVLAAMQSADWQKEGNMALAQAFAAVERVFLHRYYTPELMCAENIGLLPPMHSFGWYYAAAFDALKNEKPPEYVRLLRKGLELCPDMKAMVNFLLENTPDLQAKPAPSAELLAMAKQVRSILAAYAPDDPAVTAIKSSPVYQQVAHFIEDMDLA